MGVPYDDLGRRAPSQQLIIHSVRPAMIAAVISVHLSLFDTSSSSLNRCYFAEYNEKPDSFRNLDIFHFFDILYCIIIVLINLYLIILLRPAQWSNYKKRKGVLFMVKRKRKGVLSLSCGTRDRGGGGEGANRNLCKWNENSFEICGKFKCLPKFLLTNERFRRAQAKMTINFRENAQISPEWKWVKAVLSLWERGPFAMGKGSFQYGKGVLLRGPPSPFFLS